MNNELDVLRCRMIRSAEIAGHAHLPSAFSILELVYHLHRSILKPEDRFILSKGHGVLALYAVLGMLDRYSAGILAGHPERSKEITATTGSLGHGLAIGAGIALAKQRRGEPGRVYVLLGDQEVREGSVYEAQEIIAEYNLEVTALIDCNSYFPPAWPYWRELYVDGHSNTWLFYPELSSYPLVIKAKTVKGCGIREMETDPGAWHHRAPNAEEAQRFIDEINAN